MPTTSDSEVFLRKLEKGFSAAGISRNHSIVIAVSGGPDSTSLLLGTLRLNHRYKRLAAAHFNHRARGEESDGDEQFVRDLCSETGTALHVERAQHAVEKLGENSARQQRYRFLGQTADAVAADAIVLAHTIEDQAETVLFRIARGTGIRGAGAMRPARSMHSPSGRTVKVVRPMLQISRQEVAQFLNSERINPRHDSSNDDWRRYARNRIRHRVVPELEALNPDAVAAIGRFAAIARDNADLVDVLVDSALLDAGTDSPSLLVRSRIAELHPVVRAAVLTRAFRSVAGPDSQLDKDHIDVIADLVSTGKSTSYHLPGGFIFRSDHEHVQIVSSNDSENDVVPYPYVIPEMHRLSIPGSVDLGNGYRVDSSVSRPAQTFADAPPNEAWLTPDLVANGYLQVRNRESSDRFNPLGMDQNVRLSDFLINSKIAASWRDRIPIVVSPSGGRIAWLPGIRPAEWAKLLPNHQKAVHLRLVRDTRGH